MVLQDEIRGRLCEVFSLKSYKIDHVVHGAIASICTYGALVGASPLQIEHAIGMAVAHYIPRRAIRAGKQLSDSKGASTAISAEAAIMHHISWCPCQSRNHPENWRSINDGSQISYPHQKPWRTNGENSLTKHNYCGLAPFSLRQLVYHESGNWINIKPESIWNKKTTTDYKRYEWNSRNNRNHKKWVWISIMFWYLYKKPNI